MTPTVQKIMTIACDGRISDKYFRWIFREIPRLSFAGKKVIDRLDILREQAIFETERDEKVR